MPKKYDELHDFLLSTRSEVESIKLSFSQIEQIIGDDLPDSHLEYRQWWENQTDFSNRPQARAWLEAGFIVEEVQQSENDGWVLFRRSNIGATS